MRTRIAPNTDTFCAVVLSLKTDYKTSTRCTHTPTHSHTHTHTHTHSYTHTNIQGLHKFNIKSYLSFAVDEIQVCAAKADVVAILDHSGSIEQNQFVELTKFVGFLANLLQISEDGTRMGVVSYSASAKVNFNLNEIYNITEYRERAEAELSRDPQSFQTNHYSGLKAAADLLSDTSRGAREGVVKLMIFTTDGANNHGNK